MGDLKFRYGVRLIEKYIALAAIPVMVASPVLAAGHSDDESAIRTQASDYAQAFASGSVDKLAGMWEESAILVDQNGNVFRGRAEIKKQYAGFFDRYGGQPLDIVVESLSFPGENVAIEEGISRLKNSSTPSSTARYVATHIKRDGKWLMDSVTETCYKAANNGDYLRPLSWLIGSWKAEGPNGVLNMKSDWVNNNVISLNIEATPKDAAKLVHSEFIYWNPRSKGINSWQFDASGGTSRKWWERDGDNWVVHAISVQADGSESRADYIIKQIDKDSFSWQSRRRSLSGVELPDTGQIKVTRVKG